ncbi:MAG TPA: Verru_Chthon cassette protein A [Chthoniobacteraceae bacterium]|jgi:uncharacterized protein (TIGR02600 family)|nr:Verru_Chthon cassette protein A [Chthoniobacteraceae bacterium]
MSEQQPAHLAEGVRQKGAANRCGVALVIVLCMLVLIAVLVVGFFSNVTSDFTTTQSYAKAADARQLAEAAVNLVMAQIGQGANSSTTLTWTSQPGLIRTFDNNGVPQNFYKLYSSNAMIVPGGAFSLTTGSSDVPPAGWNNEPALYTDLNSPVLVSDTLGNVTDSNGNLCDACFPIIDGNYLVDGSTLTPPVPAIKPSPEPYPGATYLTYDAPVRNSAGAIVQQPDGVPDMNGFYVVSPPTYNGNPTQISGANNPVPMPVMWLYVLQNGTIVAPQTTGSGTIVSFSSAPAGSQPTASNPIVGRIAFWTDDDTCKVNINTAAGDTWVNSTTPPAMGSPGNPGSYWDTPRVSSPFDETCLAAYQPAQNEYQRYPGHPATTYLSAVFPTLTSAQIYQIVPRVTQGGSLGGTVTATGAIVPDTDRLYDTVDELMFAPSLSGSTRTINPPLTASAVERAKFFLTAHSRAPEVNLFGQPRVVIWPVNAANDAQHRTAFDDLIAFCGTLNNYVYYFQRSNPNSPTVDLPGKASATGLGRNRSLISYLRSLTNLPFPGLAEGGATFQSKYGQDRDQILTEIFDYIRGTNAQDTSVPGLVAYTSTNGYGEGQIVPITDTASNGTTPLRGFGHYPIITEASLLFIGRAQTDLSGSNSYHDPAIDGTSPAPGYTRIQAAFLLKFFDPNQGYASYHPNFDVNVSGLENLEWNGSSMGFPKGGGTIQVNNGNYLSMGGGDMGVTPFVWGTNYSSYCISSTMDVLTSGSSFAFSTNGTPITVQIFDPSDLSTVLQTYTLTFPNSTFPLPQLAPYLTDPNPGSGSIGTGNWCDFKARFNPANSNELQTYICRTDVVRSIVANTDPRLIAASTNVPSGMFTKISGYDTLSLNLAHGIFDTVDGNHRPFMYTQIGKLVANTLYSKPGTSPYTSAGDLNFSPALPAPQGVQPQVTGSCGIWKAQLISDPCVFTGSNGLYAVPANGVFVGGTGSVPGDWDNGAGSERDGAYVNKADEGAQPYGTLLPYFGAGYHPNGTTFFSPNRQIPSAGMFGSLPTGVVANSPWRTLLFRPDPTGNQLHIGAQAPPDYLLLDLFNMPIVEPYAISDPFSTAGKINMNYQIVPFTSITRDTALEAVLRPEQLLAISNSTSVSTTYKLGTPPGNSLRNYMDLDQTLTGFTNRFNSNNIIGSDVFRSASEICSIWLVPQGQTYANMQNYWANYPLTGDNSREKPYADIYPRLTTKSNTFTVHYRVQALKKSRNTNPAEWVEGTDQVTGEYRGYSTIERYLDTTSSGIPDYATASSPQAPQSMDSFYKFRVLETKQFAP